MSNVNSNQNVDSIVKADLNSQDSLKPAKKFKNLIQKIHNCSWPWRIVQQLLQEAVLCRGPLIRQRNRNENFSPRVAAEIAWIDR